MSDRVLDDHTTQGRDIAELPKAEGADAYRDGRLRIYGRRPHRSEDFRHDEPACDRYGWIG